jgi:hypothetical protein
MQHNTLTVRYGQDRRPSVVPVYDPRTVQPVTHIGGPCQLGPVSR